MARTRAPAPPDSVLQAAERRSEARASRDWATADELRAEIEAAGWRVTDAGTEFRLEPAHPADEEVGGEIRYGRSDAVPSVLGDAPSMVATIVLAIDAGDPAAARSVEAAVRHLPGDSGLVVVGDGIDDAAAAAVRDALEGAAGGPPTRTSAELVRTSAPLGRAAALNAGIRRASGATVIVLDACMQSTGDIVAPLIEALGDPTVAIVGPYGLTTGDLRRFEELQQSGSATRESATIQGYCMAFRRSDYVARGPLDEGFRFYRNLDIWWSLVLRDEGDDRSPRRALTVMNLPVDRAAPWAWTSTPDAERERLSKRNFYRILDRFRGRDDLAVPAPAPEPDAKG
jgi:hypothetical protein